MPRLSRFLLLGLALVALLFVAQRIKAGSEGFAEGDIFVSLSTGDVQWRHADGSLKQILKSGSGPAKSMAFDTAGNLYVPHWFNSDLSAGNLVAKFDNDGNSNGAFGAGYDCNPTSIKFDTFGNAFVGDADCSGDILKFDASGKLIGRFDVATENRGSGWIDLAPNQCVLYYTSAGQTIFRFNTCTNTQLSAFNSTPLPNEGGARGLAILPDGGVLVSNAEEILRLDSSGNVVGHYDAIGRGCWYSVSLVPGNQSFLAADYCNAEVYKFDLVTGSIQMRFTADSNGALVKSMIVYHKHENTSSPDVTCCRMTGGGSVFTDSGMRVTHGFQLRAPASDPRQNLEVNWNPAGKGEDHFHLTRLTSASCVDSPGIDAGKPDSPGDTFIARGEGTLNGKHGYTIELIFTDAGEPGRNDSATMTIRDPNGEIVLHVSGKLHNGNHQAHKCNEPKSPKSQEADEPGDKDDHDRGKH